MLDFLSSSRITKVFLFIDYTYKQAAEPYPERRKSYKHSLYSLRKSCPMIKKSDEESIEDNVRYVPIKCS